MSWTERQNLGNKVALRRLFPSAPPMPVVVARWLVGPGPVVGKEVPSPVLAILRVLGGGLVAEMLAGPKPPPYSPGTRRGETAKGAAVIQNKTESVGQKRLCGRRGPAFDCARPP